MLTDSKISLSDRLEAAKQPQTEADFAEHVDALMSEVNSLSVQMGNLGIGGDPAQIGTVRHALLRAFGALYDARKPLRADQPSIAA